MDQPARLIGRPPKPKKRADPPQAWGTSLGVSQAYLRLWLGIYVARLPPGQSPAPAGDSLPPGLLHQHGLRLNHVPRFRASHCRNAAHFSVLQIVKYPTGLRRKGTS
jgi:hypothetical protein